MILNRVHILILVHRKVSQTLLKALPKFLVFSQHLHGLTQNIIEIQGSVLVAFRIADNGALTPADIGATQPLSLGLAPYRVQASAS